MSPDIYLFDLTRAEHAADLHALREDILTDDTLDSGEKTELLEAIRRKFCERNAAAMARPKPRW